MKNPTNDNPSLLRGRHECTECGSSDSRGYYEDHFTCYGACDKTEFYEDNPGGFTKKREIEEIDFEELITTFNQIQGLPVRGSRKRGIYKHIYEFYGVHSTLNEDGEPDHRYYPWYRNNQLAAYKQKIDKTEEKGKEFYMHGDTQVMNRKDCMLFGQHLFEAGGKQLVITEGEDDCCAVQQAYDERYKGTRYPVVSLFNCNVDQVFINNLDWITSFDKVILWPDRDKNGAGLETMERYAKAIGPKAHLIGCQKYKDANDALLGESTSNYLVSQVWNAQSYTPAGFVKGEELWNRFKERKEQIYLPYPECLSGINLKLKGMRLHEIVLLTSGTGTGKSTVTKEIMLEIIAQPDTKLGIVSLEEDVGETIEKFLEMAMGVNFQDETLVIPEDGQREAFEELFSSERVIILDHQGSVGDDSLIEKLRALCAMDCTHIILDHITIAVSEGNEGLTGNEAQDKMMSDLLKLVKQFPVWLGVISHLRKTGSGGKSFEEGHMPSMDDIKGSGSIKQISFDIIGFARNMVAANDREQNTTYFRVLKARRTGKTGDAGSAHYNEETRRLEKASTNSIESAEMMFAKATPVPVVSKDEMIKRINE